MSRPIIQENGSVVYTEQSATHYEDFSDGMGAVAFEIPMRVTKAKRVKQKKQKREARYEIVSKVDRKQS